MSKNIQSNINEIRMKPLTINTITTPKGEKVRVTLIETKEALQLAKEALRPYDISLVDYTTRKVFMLQQGEILDFFYVISEAHLFQNEQEFKKCYEKGVFRLIIQYNNDFSLRSFRFYVTPPFVNPLKSKLEYVSGYDSGSQLFKVNDVYLYLQGKWKTSGYWFPNFEMFQAYYIEYQKILSTDCEEYE
jgi:hypothetical protein